MPPQAIDPARVRDRRQAEIVRKGMDHIPQGEAAMLWTPRGRLDAGRRLSGGVGVALQRQSLSGHPGGSRFHRLVLHAPSLPSQA
ncbi:hypothetical protein GCM10007859_03390 [Brevundimonas denitrificans]|uniref:Uncharacterized protein n=1 Tax=Brevundimonas denitrificans TaxID=1443434 RepID=A0ABQ6BG14_9CAUL|nr:hypothetical protein GCM10007859_03390 [Brevundimonas denitrificans]